MTAFKHILVPTDFGEASDHALAVALDLAAKFGAKVTLLHSTSLPAYYYSAYAEGLAWPTDELEGQARKKLDAVAEAAKDRCSRVETVLAAGEPPDQILEVAITRGADLIVMGTHGRRGVSRVLLGSVAEKTVRLSPVPVMTVCAEAERRAKEKAHAESRRKTEW